MAKEFNITGTCFPKKHYMADVSAQLKDTYDMIERGKYFIINRPGYLLIFDHNKKKTWKKDWVTANGKRIFWAKV